MRRSPALPGRASASASTSNRRLIAYYESSLDHPLKNLSSHVLHFKYSLKQTLVGGGVRCISSTSVPKAALRGRLVTGGDIRRGVYGKQQIRRL